MNVNTTAHLSSAVCDIPFGEYNKRQFYEISAERNRERAFNARPAGNFLFTLNNWVPQEYQGFAIVSMLSDNEGNDPLVARLVAIQKELQINLQPTYGFYQLPAESFHQTVANTLSADRFKQNILNAGLESAYPGLIEKSFAGIVKSDSGAALKMKMIGLSVFGTAIGMLGIFESETDYLRISNFRAGFYSTAELTALDVKMTRPFIGHITLTYIEHQLNKNQKEHLASVINEINESLINEHNYFNLTNTGLRRYHHLAEFLYQDNYPTFKL